MKMSLLERLPSAPKKCAHFEIPLIHRQRVCKSEPIAVNLEIGGLAASRLSSSSQATITVDVLGRKEQNLESCDGGHSLCYCRILIRHLNIAHGLALLVDPESAEVKSFQVVVVLPKRSVGFSGPRMFVKPSPFRPRSAKWENWTTACIKKPKKIKMHGNV